jgi:hypothetical protein
MNLLGTNSGHSFPAIATAVITTVPFADGSDLRAPAGPDHLALQSCRLPEIESDAIVDHLPSLGIEQAMTWLAC